MRGAYRGAAYFIVFLVAVQAAAIAWAFTGLGAWVQDGGVLDKAVMDDESGDMPFDEIVGFIIHGINGMMLIPLVALLMLIFSFFTKSPGAVGAAALLFALVVAQVAMGMFAGELPLLGALHGLNAFLIVGAAFGGASRVKKASAATTRETVPA